MRASCFKPLLAMLVSLCVVFSALALISPAQASERQALAYEDTPVVQLTPEQTERLERELAQALKESLESNVQVVKTQRFAKLSKNVSSQSPNMWTPLPGGAAGDPDDNNSSQVAAFATCVARKTAIGELADYAKEIFGQGVMDAIRRHAYREVTQRVLNNIRNGLARKIFGKILGKILISILTPNGFAANLGWAIGECIYARAWEG